MRRGDLESHLVNHLSDESIPIESRYVTPELVEVFVELSQINGSGISSADLAVCRLIDFGDVYSENTSETYESERIDGLRLIGAYSLVELVPAALLLNLQNVPEWKLHLLARLEIRRVR